MSRSLKYDYHQFKKLYEEHDGNISRLAMLLSKERNTIRSWIKKMQRDDALIAEHTENCIDKKAVDTLMMMILEERDELLDAVELATESIEKDKNELKYLKAALVGVFVSLDINNKKKAELLGVSTSTISKMNKLKMSKDTLQKIITLYKNEYTKHLKEGEEIEG